VMMMMIIIIMIVSLKKKKGGIASTVLRWSLVAFNCFSEHCY